MCLSVPRVLYALGRRVKKHVNVAQSYKKRRRLVGVVTPHSAGTLAFSTLQRRGGRDGQVLLWGSK